MRSFLRFVAAVAVMFCSTAAFAGSASATMQVSVNVIARAVLTVASQPAAFEVTKADIDRGYVDLSAPLVIEVRTNSRAGYLLQAQQQSADFSAVELSFGDAQITVNGSESWISRPYIKGGDLMSMRVRVHLASQTAPGSYPLPVAFTARPL